MRLNRYQRGTSYDCGEKIKTVLLWRRINLCVDSDAVPVSATSETGLLTLRLHKTLLNANL